MTERISNRSEYPPDISIFLDLIHRKTGALEPGEKVSFSEGPAIQRRAYDRQYICDVIAKDDPNQPCDINLWSYKSPVWYGMEKYSYDPEAQTYMRSNISAEPDILETVPPNLYEAEAKQATVIDLGRIAGILEYLEKDTSTHETNTAQLRFNRRIARLLLAQKS